MEALLQWCRGQCGSGAELTLAPLAGDASFRRYFRVLGAARPLVAVLAPPATQRNREFVAIAAQLRAAGVHTPELVGCDFGQGFLLLEDFGDRLMLGELSEATVEAHYARAYDTLLAIQRTPCAAGDWALPPYSAALLEQELRLFPEWFLGGLLDYRLQDAEQALLEALFAQLVAEAQAQPQVFVHRDFHSRNLMPLADGTLGVIDFQDAVRGPVTYDLVSLLRDCYVAWAPARVEAWALDYARRAQAAGILGEYDQAQFLRWFDGMGLQRHIKVLGIFARLWLRDGKPAFLQDLPRVMHYVTEVAERHADWQPVAAWFRARLLPLALRQPWYRAA